MLKSAQGVEHLKLGEVSDGLALVIEPFIWVFAKNKGVLGLLDFVVTGCVRAWSLGFRASRTSVMDGIRTRSFRFVTLILVLNMSLS